MLRGLIEKIPSFIVKTVSNPQVNHNFIRSLSRAKRSCSCADGDLSTRASKFSLSERDNNERKGGSMDVINTKSTAFNSIPFYSTISRDGSNNQQFKLHKSRIDEDIRENRNCERYQLEAARPKPRYKFNVEECNEYSFSKDVLQPKNLKPFRSPHMELALTVGTERLPLIKKVSMIETINNSNATDIDNKISDEIKGNDYSHKAINESSNSNDEEIPKYDYKKLGYTYSNNYIPRPSYSEYINLRTNMTNSQNKNILNTKQDIPAAQWRGYSNISNVNEKNPDDLSYKQNKKDSYENILVENSTNRNIFTSGIKTTSKSVFSSSRLRRLYIKSGQTIPSYSDYIKSQTAQPISVPNELPNKFDNLGTATTRTLLVQNNTDVEQKRQFSSTPHLAVGKKSYTNSDFNSNNSYTQSSNTGTALLPSENANSVSLISSRTYFMCPSYSDYLKTSQKHSIVEVEPSKDIKHLFSSKIVNTSDVGQNRPLSTKKSNRNTPTVQTIVTLNKSQKREISSNETSIFHRRSSENSKYTSLDDNHSVAARNPLLTTYSKQYSSKKKCKPKPDPCEPEKPKKCFLPSTVRLPPFSKCSPKYKPCPIPDKCPPRADDCMCVKAKQLPVLHPAGCICIDPYIPEKAPGLKRLKFVAPDPPRICPPPICADAVRADDNLVQKPKKLRPIKPKPCDCIEPPPMVDVPLIRLKKICEDADDICYPPKPCPPPPPCIRADDNLCVKPKKLPILVNPVCPCIEETVKDAPPLKRLNLKSPEPPRICPRPCICKVDCPRADDNLVIKAKPLPPIKPGECPCIEPEMVDVEYKRLKCIEDPEECHYTDPCEVPHPRADFGCWEYYVPEPKPICREVEIKSPKKPCKKSRKNKTRT
ncbi:uncharacterized protein LOC130897413 [Diorhabda carinulata]|uniref:uncharacterized protein LOC130897413 n=1 Tax=Diorhabda carinulata TaxID=1163345 RepID=UPI0025A1A0CD|nr:uncharacterized protein LOC130897413 [Diorhabda carinulata]